MKALQCVGILIAILLLTNVSSKAATSEKSTKVVTGAIVEMSEKGEYLLLGDYSINRLGTISIDSGAGQPVPGTVKDLSIGTVAKAHLEEKDASGSWKATELVIYTGVGREKAAKEGGVALTSLPDTSSSTAADSEAEQTSEAKKTKRQDVIKLENGVFTN